MLLLCAGSHIHSFAKGLHLGFARNSRDRRRRTIAEERHLAARPWGDGHDFEAIVPELRLSESLRLRFVFPHAPMRPVTINGGATMRAWYDILSLDREGTQDEKGIRASSDALDGLLEREHQRGIPY